jgi:hypothetical protein
MVSDDVIFVFACDGWLLLGESAWAIGASFLVSGQMMC